MTPQFYISATLRESESSPSTAGGGIGGGVQGLLALSPSEGNAYTEFKSNLYSYIVAQRMWQEGWATQIYAAGDKTKDINKIERRHSISEKISSFLLGYDLYDYYSPHDLQDYIAAKVSVSKAMTRANISASMMTPDQPFGINFLNELILVTDQYAKEYLILKSQGIIESTQKQLAVSRNSAITASLSASINKEYLKIAILENDMPYHIYFIDPPYSSEYPVSPNTFAIFWSSFIIFVISSIMFHFIRDNKDDLW
jgi:predicted DNA-binding transcriptional regulator